MHGSSDTPEARDPSSFLGLRVRAFRFWGLRCLFFRVRASRFRGLGCFFFFFCFVVSGFLGFRVLVFYGSGLGACGFYFLLELA